MLGWCSFRGGERLQIGRLFGEFVVTALVVGNALLDLSDKVQPVPRQLLGQQFRREQFAREREIANRDRPSAGDQFVAFGSGKEHRDLQVAMHKLVEVCHRAIFSINRQST